jgi:hypothetical protein
MARRMAMFVVATWDDVTGIADGVVVSASIDYKVASAGFGGTEGAAAAVEVCDCEIAEASGASGVREGDKKQKPKGRTYKRMQYNYT